MAFPVDSVVPELAAALAAGGAAVLVAEPGAGKTTRVPLALMDQPWLQGRKIVMLEPRRLATRAAARRMAATLGEEAGGTVGYAMRLERRVSARSRIEVVTEGILTRRLQNDPELADVGLLIFDEFHERSLDADLGLALALDARASLRPDLRLLIMSATLDAAGLSAHLGGAPVISASGRMFPVATRHLPRTTRQALVEDAAKAVHTALAASAQSVLVFLPGEGEIRRVEQRLAAESLPANTSLHPLYGALAAAAQDAAIAPPPAGHRKVVLATTIAETSLTIEGIGAVVDTGFKRVARFDPASGMTALETVRVSQAAADQRRGRAGRLGPGVCFRLWPEEETRALAAHDAPEIRVADLAPLVLELAAWGVTEAAGLPWLELPPAAHFAQGQDLLKRLEAVDAAGRITPHGRQLARLPLHPRLAHMVVRAKEHGAGAEAAEVAALISERDGLAREAGVDIEQRLLMVRGAARERIKQAARQIRQIADIPADDRGTLSHGVMLALAWPDRIGQRRGGDRRYRLAGGGGAVLPDHDALAKQDFLAVALTDGASGDQKIHLAAALSRSEMEAHFSALITVSEDVYWDVKTEAVSAARRETLGALILSERPLPTAAPEAMTAAMVTGVARMGLASLPWTEEAEAFRARLGFVARVMPELGLPDLSDGALLTGLQDWLAPYLAGISARRHLSRLDLLAILRAMVPHDVLRRMEKLAPARIEVPSGAAYRIDYRAEAGPTLRVRLQEMFGLATTPSIADGRAHLRIELLSPAGRPLAVTQSLETFWTNAYPDVRADMRGRYPKHKWPDNPLETPPVPPRRVR